MLRTLVQELGLYYDEPERCVFERKIVIYDWRDGSSTYGRFEKPGPGAARNNVFCKNGGHGVHSTKACGTQQLVVKNNTIAHNGGYGIKGRFESAVCNPTAFWRTEPDAATGQHSMRGTPQSSRSLLIQKNRDLYLKSEEAGWHPTLRRWVTDKVTCPCIDARAPDEGFSKISNLMAEG